MEKRRQNVIPVDSKESRNHIVCELRSIYRELKIFPMVEELSQGIPTLEPNSLLNAMKDNPRGLLFHVYTSTKEIMKLSRDHKGITREEKALAIAAVLYHDALKLTIRDDKAQRISQQDIYGHSIGMGRIFQYFELPELAQAVRHNPLDFLADVSEDRVTIPQLLLNISDRLNVSGVPVSLSAKERHLRNKFEKSEDFNSEADMLCTDVLLRAMKENNFRDLPFITNDVNSTSRAILLQRFDDKYVEPRGKYRDTSSNYHMGRQLATFAHNTTIVHNHEGKIKAETHVSRKGETVLHGIDGKRHNIVEELIRLSHSHESIVVEGWTSILPELRQKIGDRKPIILLVRAMSGGQFEDERLLNALYADEIWVMTDQMKEIVYSQLKPLESSNFKIPKIRVLTSGIDNNVFYPPRSSSLRQPGKITYVGGITKLKGVDVLLDAFEIVKQSMPYIELHLIGDPAIYGTKNEFDTSRLKKDGVVYHGVLVAEDVANELRTAHVSVLLTRIFEAYGKAAMQARACGTPMIVSSQGALPLHVQSEEEGIVLEDVNPIMVAEALKKMLSNEPKTVLPPVNRYHTWQKTAVDFATNLSLCRRDLIANQISQHVQ